MPQMAAGYYISRCAHPIKCQTPACGRAIAEGKLQLVSINRSHQSSHRHLTCLSASLATNVLSMCDDGVQRAWQETNAHHAIALHLHPAANLYRTHHLHRRPYRLPGLLEADTKGPTKGGPSVRSVPREAQSAWWEGYSCAGERVTRRRGPNAGKGKESVASTKLMRPCLLCLSIRLPYGLCWASLFAQSAADDAATQTSALPMTRTNRQRSVSHRSQRRRRRRRQRT